MSKVQARRPGSGSGVHYIEFGAPCPRNQSWQRLPGKNQLQFCCATTGTDLIPRRHPKVPTYRQPDFTSRLCSSSHRRPKGARRRRPNRATKWQPKLATFADGLLDTVLGCLLRRSAEAWTSHPKQALARRNPYHNLVSVEPPFTKNEGADSRGITRVGHQGQAPLCAAVRHVEQPLYSLDRSVDRDRSAPAFFPIAPSRMALSVP